MLWSLFQNKIFIDSKRVSVLESKTDQILEEVKVIGGKVDLLLEEAEASLSHFFRDAMIALKTQNYPRARKVN